MVEEGKINQEGILKPERVDCVLGKMGAGQSRQVLGLECNGMS